MRIEGYTGPADWRSHPSERTRRWLKPVAGALMNGLFRVEVEGSDKLSPPGTTVYCPTHPSTADPPLMGALIEGDTRFMANQILFRGRLGPLLTGAGAYPVDRDRPMRTTVEHSIELVRDGKKLVIFPEGGLSEDPTRLGPLKMGPAKIALEGGADQIVPIGLHYAPDARARPLADAAGLALSAAVAGTSAAAFGLGGPLALVMGAVTGGAVGAAVSARVAGHCVPVERDYNPLPHRLAALVGGLAGGLAGACLGACLQGGVVQAAAGGVATWALARARIHRPLARVTVGDPVPVTGDTSKANVRALTEKLHAALGGELAELTGVPYEPGGQKIRSGPPPAEATFRR